MKKVVRAEHITKVSYKALDIKNEKVIDDTITLPHWYTSHKILVTKLTAILQEQNLRLIEVTKDPEKYTRYYSQTLVYFKENCESYKDVLQKSRKEKE